MSIDGVLACDQVTVRGWILDEQVPTFPMLRKGEPCPQAPGRLMEIDTPQIPDLALIDTRFLPRVL